MADRNPAVGIALLFLVLMPQVAVSGKYPRFSMTPRTKKQVGQFFKHHASDMSDILPSQSQSSKGEAEPGGGGVSNGGQSNEAGAGGGSNSAGGGGSQQQHAAATTAGKYIFSFDVGTPPQRVSGALDIGSDLVWTQCGTTLLGTTDGTVFDPSRSSSMTVVPCTSTTCQRFVAQTCFSVSADAVPQCYYSYSYGGGSAVTDGYLATEAFRFDNDSSSDPVKVVFGCGFASTLDDASGVIGLGRGAFSLVSQLQADRFSYYFAPDDSTSGTDSFIHFGDDATPITPSRVLPSTPLLANTAYPHLYYVGLTGVRVDGQDLAIPRGTFDLQTDGSGGVIMSITVPVTVLDEVAYKVVRAAVVSKIGLPTVDGSALLGLDLCYANQSLAAAKIPAMGFVFDGGAVMELETWNYFYLDATTGLECLAMVPGPAGTGSLLGNLIQAGTHMIYDIRGSKLMFESLNEQASPSPFTNSSGTSYGKGSPRRSSSAPALRIVPLVAVNFVWLLAYMMLQWAAF